MKIVYERGFFIDVKNLFRAPLTLIYKDRLGSPGSGINTG